ncbi:MAG: hypothetical protein ACI4EF_00450 [Coprococcus sp.]
MAKKDNQTGVYKRPQKGWSPATNRIVGIIFIVFVLACFIIRGFVGGKSDNNKSNGNAQVTSSESDDGNAQVTSSENDDEKSGYYTFRNESTLESHYEKHGEEFNYNNVNEYQDGANSVINNPDSLHKLEKEDGDDIYYLEETNEFVVVSTDGYIRTYFKPTDGKDYYDRQ